MDLAQPIIVDGVNYGAPLDNLAAAMTSAGLSSVDLWVGTGGIAVAQLVVPVVQPKTYIPTHWDGLFNSFWAGLPFPYVDDTLKAYLETNGIQRVVNFQYFDKYRLDARGLTPVSNHGVKARLGFSDVQNFPTSASAAVRRRAKAPDLD